MDQEELHKPRPQRTKICSGVWYELARAAGGGGKLGPRSGPTKKESYWGLDFL